jgi:hypothetical protein
MKGKEQIVRYYDRCMPRMRYQPIAKALAALVLFASACGTASGAATKEEDFKTVSGRQSWDYRYDVSSLSPGKYNLLIEGTDSAGNSSVAGPFNVYVDPKSDLPVVTFSAPTPNQRVGGDLAVVGTAVDDDGVDRVEVSLDKGDFAPAEGKDYWSLSLPVGSVLDGPHTLRARAVDINGVTGTDVTTRFNLDTRAPVIRMTSHEGGALVGGTLALAGVVEDANGVRSLSWSSDSRATFTPLRLQADKSGTNARYSLGVDTRKLKDGPHVYWFRAVDLTGSVGTLAFLFFVDNTGPVVDVISPAPGSKSSGVVTVVGKITELVGIRSLAWNAGEAGSGTVDLVPGDPYWAQDIDLSKVKGSSARVSFTAVDKAGNSSARQAAIALLPDEADLAVVTLRSPAANGRFAASVPLAGTVRDDDGVRGIAWSIDGKPTGSVDSAEAFSISLTGISPGKHRVSVHGIDVTGRPGKDVNVDVLVTGDPPVVTLDSVSTGASSLPFRPGVEIARDKGSVLHGKIVALARVPTVTAAFNGIPAEKPALRPGSQPGQTLFDVKVPAGSPFGLVTVLIAATDEYGQVAERRFLVHVTNYTLRLTEPGVQFSDARIRADGTVALGTGGPLAGIMAGEEISSVSMDPATDIVNVAADGDRIIVSPARSGVSGPVRVKVTTKKGHTFTSDAWRFITDAVAPVVRITSPVSGSWLAGGLRVEGTVSDDTGIGALELSLDGGRTWSPVPAPAAGSTAFQATPPVDGVPDGPLDVVVRCTDAAGNAGLDHVVVRRDTTAPTITMLAPRADDPIGGSILVAGTATDNGAVAKVELSTDGASWTEMPVKGAFATVIDAAGAAQSPAGITIRATDRAGNSSTASVPVPSGGSGTGTEPAGAKDTVKPTIEVISPSADARVHGAVFFIGRASDNTGLRRVSFDAGADGKGEVTLVPGSPWFAQEIDLKDQKPTKLVVTFTAEDSSGNRSDARLTANVDPGVDEPAVTVVAPGPRAAVEGRVLVSGTVSSRAAVAGISLSVDGAAETQLAPGDAFAAILDPLPPGPHKLTVRAVDAAGARGPAAVVELTGTGSAPTIALAGLVAGKQSQDYTPGARLVVAPGSTLSGSVAVSATLKGGEYSLLSGPARPLAVRKPEKAGAAAGFDIPLPADLPHGRIDIRVTVTDDRDRRSDLLAFFYRVDPETGASADEEGISFLDPRIGADGGVLLSPGDTLEGFFNGRPISAVALEPETPVISVSFDGSAVILTAAREGIQDGARVRLTTVDGDTYRSEPLSIRVDAGAPQITIAGPAAGAWVGSKLTLQVSATDSLGVAATEYAIGESGAFVALQAAAQGSPGSWEALVDLSAIPEDGALDVVVRARDVAGRIATLTLPVMKDTQAPVLALLTPTAGDAVNGLITVAGAAKDDGVIASVELSTDGKTWSPLPAKPVFSSRIDLSKVDPSLASFRVTDRSGNMAVLVPSMNVQQAADVPVLDIQVPQEGDVQRSDFVVSGTVLDDDGVGEILHRVDGGEFTRLPGANTFAIPIALADITDNEHTIEVKAEDLNGVPSEVRTCIVRVSKAEPVSRLVTPALSTTSRGVITLEGQSVDKNGIARVELSLDNGQTFRAAEGKEGWTYRVDTRALKDGTYSVFVRATDAYGTVGLGSTLVNIDNTPPDIVVDQPADGAPVTGSFTLAGRALDDIAVADLSARIRPLGSTAEGRRIELPGGPFAQTVDLAGMEPGWYDVSIEGADRAANTTDVSRNILVQPGTVGERLDITFPVNGETLHGPVAVSGRISSVRAPSAIVLLVDGNEAGTGAAKEGGYVTVTASSEALADGAHSIVLEARFAEGPALRSEGRTITWQAAGPWVRLTSHILGDWVRERPFLSGEAGRTADPAEPVPEDATGKRKAAEEHKLLRVEISLDNGRTFAPAQGKEKWKYRLETQTLPDGPVRVMVKAVFADGATAVDETILRLDDTPPQVRLLSPREEGRFNGDIALLGTAEDENGMAQVRAAVRKGDKANYEVPSFIQGLYFDGHVLGATDWDVGAGLTFFDQNVKLQVQFGMAPEGRFSGAMFGAKLLANIFRLPFGSFLGPDFDFLSASLAVGANFSYVTNSGNVIQFTDQGLILGAVVAQLEFPIFRIRSWPVFNTWSTYTEYQLWFISSDVSAGIVNRLSFGVRVGLF